MKLKFKFRRRLLEEENFDREGQNLPGRRESSVVTRAKNAIFVEDSADRQEFSMLARPLLKGGLE
jgi:hypothetical protein